MKSLALVVVLACGGCAASTKYTPASDGSVKLVVKKGKLALFKDGTVQPAADYDMGGFGRGSDATTLFACDDEAARLHRAAAGQMFTAQWQSWIGIAVTFAGFLVLPSAPIVSLMGLGVTLYASTIFADGMHDVVDAMNRHNDVVACTRRAPPAVAPTGSDAQGVAPQPVVDAAPPPVTPAGSDAPGVAPPPPLLEAPAPGTP